MTLALYAHPFSSYCQKTLIAIYENAVPFDFKMLAPDAPDNGAKFAEVWPLMKMPVLIDGATVITESSIIIEYLQTHYAGPSLLIPIEPALALEVRRMDRCVDNYVMTPTQTIVGNHLRPVQHRDSYGIELAEKQLDASYAWLDNLLQQRRWAAGATFSLADCAAAPALFYADWVHEIPARLATLRAYRARLLERPSVARTVDEARPYRPLFPLGAPDRD